MHSNLRDSPARRDQWQRQRHLRVANDWRRGSWPQMRWWRRPQAPLTWLRSIHLAQRTSHQRCIGHRWRCHVWRLLTHQRMSIPFRNSCRRSGQRRGRGMMAERRLWHRMQRTLTTQAANARRRRSRSMSSCRCSSRRRCRGVRQPSGSNASGSRWSSSTARDLYAGTGAAKGGRWHCAGGQRHTARSHAGHRMRRQRSRGGVRVWQVRGRGAAT